MVIAIDGPAGTGKGTISKLIADRLGYIYIDTGAMYRAITLKTIRENIKLEEIDKIEKMLIDTVIDFGEAQKVFMDGEDVTSEIRMPKVSEEVPYVSSLKIIRENLVAKQRALGLNKNIVMEGRDITTVVFPNADLKIYLTADASERAKRRYDEMVEKGITTTYDEVYTAILKRDETDMNKEIGALKIAEDAIVVDSTGKSIEEVYNEILKYIKMKGE